MQMCGSAHFLLLFFLTKNKQTKAQPPLLGPKKQNKIAKLTESESTALAAWVGAIIAWSVIMTDFSVHFSVWNTKLQWIEKMSSL